MDDTVLESTTGAVQLHFTNDVGGGGELASADVEMALCSQTSSFVTRPRVIVVRGAYWLSFCVQFRPTAALPKRKTAPKKYALRLSFRGVPVCERVFKLQQNKKARSDVDSRLVDMDKFAFAPSAVLSACYAFNAALPWGPALRAGYDVVPLAVVAAATTVHQLRQGYEGSGDDDDDGDDAANIDDKLMVVVPRKQRMGGERADAVEYDGRGCGPMGAALERAELVAFQARLEALSGVPIEQRRLLRRRLLWVAHRLRGVLGRPVSACKRIALARASRATLAELAETLALHKQAGLSDDAAVDALNTGAAPAAAIEPVVPVEAPPPLWQPPPLAATVVDPAPLDGEPTSDHGEGVEQMALQARWPLMSETERATAHALRMTWVERRLVGMWHKQGSVGARPPEAAVLAERVRYASRVSVCFCV